MEIHFTPLRTGLLVALLATFAFLGGFTPPSAHFGMEVSGSQINRSWLSCVALFVAGAGMATIVDHWVGLMPPSNLRLLYVVVGILLMAVAILWYRSMLATWAVQLGIP
ncbi:MAG: hypothetical protein KDN18_18000 [Verrucomicrobiae bacterium]|nr:hypothetical protein [Verrucomicrobiae bacterium]